MKEVRHRKTNTKQSHSHEEIKKLDLMDVDTEIILTRDQGR
jgi:hypothetical protein